LPSAEVPDAEQVVLDFCAAWADGDSDALASCFSHDATYRNIPAPEAVEGREAIRRFLEGALAQMDVEFLVHRSASRGAVVFTERTDVLTMADGARIELPVAGIAEVRHGLITVWRDYYDSAAAPPPRPRT
jgi:limonene-1,2-epoxide hydrolase